MVYRLTGVQVQEECKRLKSELERTKSSLQKEEELARYRQGQLLDLQGKVKGLEVFGRHGAHDRLKVEDVGGGEC